MIYILAFIGLLVVGLLVWALIYIGLEFGNRREE